MTVYNFRTYLLLWSTLVLGNLAHAYDNTSTHIIISKAAVKKSVIETDINVLKRLGVLPIGNSMAVLKADYPLKATNISAAVALGSKDEDIPAIRVINHFYDPIYDSGVFYTSPSWATEDVGDALFQRFSYKDAKSRLYSALTDPSSAEREKNFVLTFQTLGQVIHHLQDMAQPQHVRMDAHLNIQETLQKWGLPDGELFFENRSRFEEYVSSKFKDPMSEDTTDTRPILPVAGGGAMPVKFATPREYWINSGGDGIAQFTNRNFLSAGTNFELNGGGQALTTRYQKPAPQSQTDVALSDLNGGDIPAYVASSCPPDSPPPALPNCVMTFYSTSENITNPRASSLSIFDQDLIDRQKSVIYAIGSGTRTVTRVFALNKYNFDAALPHLIPRAVGYSAGLINHFFRGQMEITPPDEGVYSLVDHFDFSGDMQPATNAATGFKGFKTIKLKLKNTTPNEEMTRGTLVAVLKFYRNLAYTDDLAGELANQAAYQMSRSTAEEIVVSTRVKDKDGLVITGPIAVTNTDQTFIFEFGQELPINATDVKLQVVYRGILGSETDAVVVQTVDISEPTYLTYMNATDYIKIGSSVYTRERINSNGTPTDGYPSGSVLRSQIQPASCIDSMTDQFKDEPGCHQPFNITFPMKWGTSATANATVSLPLDKTYHRFAMLAPIGAGSVNRLESLCLPNDAIPFTGKQVQTNFIPNSSPAGYVISINVDAPPLPVRAVRGGTLVACVNNGDNSLPGSVDDRRIKMTPLTGANLKPRQALNLNFGAP